MFKSIFEKKTYGTDRSGLYKSKINDGFKCSIYIVFKLVYTSTVVRMSWFTKKTLNSSLQMRADNMMENEKKKKIYTRLFIFSLLPALLSILFFVHEFPSIYLFLKAYHVDLNELRNLCDDEGVWYTRVDVFHGVQLASLTIGLGLYIVGYIVLYKSVRRSFVRSSDGNA